MARAQGREKPRALRLQARKLAELRKGPLRTYRTTLARKSLGVG